MRPWKHLSVPCSSVRTMPRSTITSATPTARWPPARSALPWTIAADVDEEGGDVSERVKPKLANGLEPIAVPAPGSIAEAEGTTSNTVTQ